MNQERAPSKFIKVSRWVFGTYTALSIFGLIYGLATMKVNDVGTGYLIFLAPFSIVGGVTGLIISEVIEIRNRRKPQTASGPPPSLHDKRKAVIIGWAILIALLLLPILL